MLEIYKRWDLNGKKEIYTDKNGAATAVAFRQTAAYHGTGRVAVADSWFSTDEMWSLF